ncbi:SDR family NAD(P)-dependent oxidoreductase [Mucilaginibacter ginkgonis]|uniref:SDR family NAD(P)-dependent oxidoreductase n=1 Tax=Mucilaginibacter ginkgonis TaxID=2682091 RepID=A0A6I4I1P8_9SPHI|nr:SDR family NAD(P)-dependent oxidoreductase [Mucilaginibacter ginkgonis]QQL48753.1 SDR family NAD(P)-dependent oxidoreductase [Mucilaginibacter ginkgonis]
MILVTGATGFLGAELAKQLAEAGHHIRCTRRESSVIPEILILHQNSIDWVTADITDISSLADAFKGVTQVYHSAAWVSFSKADKVPMIFTNVTGTANIVNLCLENNARLVHVSSVAALGDAKPGKLIDENAFIEDTPVGNPYAISKLESEMEVWRGIAEGLDGVIVNPSVIIGADAGKEGSGRLFEKVRNGLNFYTSGSCGFVDVADAAKCMITLMESNITDERFIISAENRYFKEFLPTVAGRFGVNPPTINAKPWMLSIASAFAGFGALFTGNNNLDTVTARYASKELNFDNSKIKAAIGFSFKPVNETVDKIVRRLKVS